MELGLVRNRNSGRSYVVEYDSSGTIVAASAPVELGTRDWTEDELQGWHMEPAEWLAAADDDGDIDRLPIPYLPYA